MLEPFLISVYPKSWSSSGVSLRCRTPRTKFAIYEKGVCVRHTDPPIRGVLVQAQMYTSFTTSKARGVLHTLATPLHFNTPFAVVHKMHPTRLMFVEASRSQ
jgi:hypothetical protein